MTSSVYSAAVSAILERVGIISPDEAEALSDLWFEREQIAYVSINGGMTGELIAPQNAWNRAVQIGEGMGRTGDLDAAIAAVRALRHSLRRSRLDPRSRAGAEQAVRATVLAVARHDLIDRAD